MLLNVPDQLGDDNVTSARQGAVLDEKTAPAESGDHTVKQYEKGFPADDVSLRTCEMDIMSLIVRGVPSFLANSLTRAPQAKLAKSTPES